MAFKILLTYQRATVTMYSTLFANPQRRLLLQALLVSASFVAFSLAQSSSSGLPHNCELWPGWADGAVVVNSSLPRSTLAMAVQSNTVYIIRQLAAESVLIFDAMPKWNSTQPVVNWTIVACLDSLSTSALVHVDTPPNSDGEFRLYIPSGMSSTAKRWPVEVSAMADPSFGLLASGGLNFRLWNLPSIAIFGATPFEVNVRALATDTALTAVALPVASTVGSSHVNLTLGGALASNVLVVNASVGVTTAVAASPGAVVLAGLSASSHLTLSPRMALSLTSTCFSIGSSFAKAPLSLRQRALAVHFQIDPALFTCVLGLNRTARVDITATSISFADVDRQESALFFHATTNAAAVNQTTLAPFSRVQLSTNRLVSELLWLEISPPSIGAIGHPFVSLAVDYSDDSTISLDCSPTDAPPVAWTLISSRRPSLQSVSLPSSPNLNITSPACLFQANLHTPTTGRWPALEITSSTPNSVNVTASLSLTQSTRTQSELEIGNQRLSLSSPPFFVAYPSLHVDWRLFLADGTSFLRLLPEIIASNQNISIHVANTTDLTVEVPIDASVSFNHFVSDFIPNFYVIEQQGKSSDPNVPSRGCLTPAKHCTLDNWRQIEVYDGPVECEAYYACNSTATYSIAFTTTNYIQCLPTRQGYNASTIRLATREVLTSPTAPNTTINRSLEDTYDRQKLFTSAVVLVSIVYDWMAYIFHQEFIVESPFLLVVLLSNPDTSSFTSSSSNSTLWALNLVNKCALSILSFDKDCTANKCVTSMDAAIYLFIALAVVLTPVVSMASVRIFYGRYTRKIFFEQMPRSPFTVARNSVPVFVLVIFLRTAAWFLLMVLPEYTVWWVSVIGAVCVLVLEGAFRIRMLLYNAQWRCIGCSALTFLRCLWALLPALVVIFTSVGLRFLGSQRLAAVAFGFFLAIGGGVLIVGNALRTWSRSSQKSIVIMGAVGGTLYLVFGCITSYFVTTDSASLTPSAWYWWAWVGAAIFNAWIRRTILTTFNMRWKLRERYSAMLKAGRPADEKRLSIFGEEEGPGGEESAGLLSEDEGPAPGIILSDE